MEAGEVVLHSLLEVGRLVVQAVAVMVVAVAVAVMKQQT